MIEGLTDLQNILVLFAGSITVFTGVLSAISKSFRDILSAPFTRKSQKIKLDKDNLDFVSQLQKFQTEELDKLIIKLRTQKEEFETIFREQEELIIKYRRHNAYYEGLLTANNIEHEKLEE